MNKLGISLIIITYNRKKDLEYTLNTLKNIKKSCNFELIIIDQNSTDGTSDLFNMCSPEVKYVKLDKNLGVAGGRNYGASIAQYEYMIFIDDDSNFVNETAIDDIYNCMKSNKDINIFSFKITNLNKGLYNWPYSNKKLKQKNSKFYANIYIGCGHAIKKTFFSKVGGYSDSLFFWGEEIELSLKTFIIDGTPILYNGNIEIMHRVTPTKRISEKNGRYYYKVRNRLIIVRDLYPVSAVFIFLYYFIGYGIQSVLKRTYDQYLSAVKDYKNMHLKKFQRIKFKNWIKYVFIYFHR